MKIKKYFSLFLLVTSTLVLAFGCGEDVEKEEAIRPIRYEQVSISGGEQIRVFTGNSQAGISTNLSFKVSGTIQKIDIKVGDNVRRGQIIAEIDPKDYRLQLQEAEAALVEANSQLSNARSNYGRVRQLYESRSASRSDLDGARATFETAKATVDRMQKSLELSRRQVGYTKLTAPTNGTIASKNVQINENVQAGQSIAMLNVGKDMEVALGLPENIINFVEDNMNVDVAFPAIENKSFRGVISEVSPSLDPNSASYPVRIKIVNPTSDVKAGMAANITFTFGSDSIEELMVVPVTAVGEDSEGRFVFVIQDSDSDITTVQKKYIQVGKLTSEGFEVLSGLSLGERVATAGLQSLLDGQKVRIL